MFLFLLLYKTCLTILIIITQLFSSLPSAEVTSADFSSVSTNVIVTHDGNVTWLSMVIFKSSCSIDVQYFPFDEQNCSMSFSSWTYDAYQVNILNVGTEGDTSNYMNSTEWNLVKFVQQREVNISCVQIVNS